MILSDSNPSQMTAPAPLVSIITPFYNAGAEFKAALRSILNQTFDDWELLLCDDGSTDGSLALARSMRDHRITVWSDGRRKGLAGRLNECIDRARGEFIARMDADDISYPERLAKQVEFLKARPDIDLVGCSMLIFGEDGSPLGKRVMPTHHERIVARPALGFGLAHPTWMARASWFRQHRYDLAALRYEDVELLYRSYKTSRFANLPEVLYGYRELRGGFRKRLKTRIGRVCYLCARRGQGERAGAGERWISTRAALAESVRIVSDSALAAISARYAMLRLRETRISESETAGWRRVLDAADSSGGTMALLSIGEFKA